VGAELPHTDRQADSRTDMTKLIVAFCNLANAPKNASFSIIRFSTFHYLVSLFKHYLHKVNLINAYCNVFMSSLANFVLEMSLGRLKQSLNFYIDISVIRSQ